MEAETIIIICISLLIQLCIVAYIVCVPMADQAMLDAEFANEPLLNDTIRQKHDI